MKQQLLDGQDTEDDKLAWRVEAELRLRLDELRRTEGAAAAELAAQLAQVQARATPCPTVQVGGGGGAHARRPLLAGPLAGGVRGPTNQKAHAPCSTCCPGSRIVAEGYIL